jgi:sugar/nucleoside kinase (ribokinase family)
VGTTLRSEVGLDVFQALHQKGVQIGTDVQGFVRVLRGQSLIYEPWDEMAVILPYVDILKSDAVEAEFLTDESNIHRAAKFFASLGAKEIVLTHRDGVLVYTGSQAIETSFKPRELIGRSGRGDTCLGTYAAMRLSAPPAEAAVWAAAVTSLKMEKLGPADRTRAEIVDFIDREYSNGAVRIQELLA